MWSTSEEPPPGEIEGEESVVHAREKCEQNKSQLESLKEIMLKNKQSLMKKEEEAQEYARRLSKIKSRAKLSRRSKEGSVGVKDTTHLTESPGMSEGLNIDDISQAKTPKARSTLLQKKLAENRKAFEQRNKEIIETKRAVEEKVEAIRQQLEEKDVAAAAVGFQREQLSVLPVKPVMITSDVMTPVQIESIQEKDNKIAELTNKMLELEATIVDLQENLKEKDSVIESKTRAVTLMSADLSRKGKTTLDTLEDTKDEMRTMQEHFVLLEESLKNKNENLLVQLQERDKKIEELEDSVDRFEKQIGEQKLSESASADFSRSTMDALVETKEAMRSMQENFVLMESSLKTKNENLLRQLNDYELKLAEANERVFQLESGVGIVKDPSVDDLRYKLEKLETNNRQLQDEKYELQKSVAELQDKIVNISSMHGNGAIIEKDNRILELENLIEELKQSNKLLEEESKSELEKQVTDLTSRNEEYLNKVTELESLVHRLEEEKNEIAARLLGEGAVKEDEKVARLTKELEDLNKSMIKIKAQHKSKVKSLQKQLEDFKKVSDTNAELVKLGNQVALLEEEKGNLQLSLVDFDELKASAGDWQERVIDLESKVSAQTKEIEMQIDAIATLENQKLDLMQELHSAKQEISSLEAENAESENLRVTAEMKVVDLEEQLETVHKSQPEIKTDHSELLKQIQSLTQENTELYNRITKLEEKGTSDTGSTESFEAIQELDKIDLLKKLEDLTQRNNELTLKLHKYEESGTVEDSVNDPSRNELLKRIDQLTQENTDLTMKLSRMEEKGSDTGSTESFERIPEHNEGVMKIEVLTQENNELATKVVKLEEELKRMSESDRKYLKSQMGEENDDQLELPRLRSELTNFIEENNKLKEENKLLSSNKTERTEVTERISEISESSKEDISDLRIELSELRLELTNLTEENGKLKDEIELLSSSKAEKTEKTEATERTFEISGNSNEEIDLKVQLTNLIEENNKLKGEIELLSTEKANLSTIERTSEILETSKDEIDFRSELINLIEENNKLKEQIELLSTDKTDLPTTERISETSEPLKGEIDLKLQVESLLEEKSVLQKEVKELRNSLQQWHETTRDTQIDELRMNLEELLKAKDELLIKLSELETLNKKLERDLLEVVQEKEELRLKLDQLLLDDEKKEEMKLIEKLEKLYEEKLATKLSEFETLNRNLEKDLLEANQEKTELRLKLDQLFPDDKNKQINLIERLEKFYTEQIITREKRDVSSQKSTVETHETSNLQLKSLALLENEIESYKKLITELTSLVEEMRMTLSNKEEELEEKIKQIETSGRKIEVLENELKEMSDTMEEWKFKCNEMESQIERLEAGKASIEERFKLLQNENEILSKENREKDATADSLKQELEDVARNFESKLQTQLVTISEKDNEISCLKEELEERNRDLQNKFTELRNKMIAIDTLQDEINGFKHSIEEKDSSLTAMSNEISDLNRSVKSKEEEISLLKRDIIELSGKIEDSKPVKDYNDLLERLKDKDMILNEMELKMNATTRENIDLIETVKDMSQWKSEAEDELDKKREELVSLMRTRDDLEAQIVEYKNDRAEAEKKIKELQSAMKDEKIVDDLQMELRDSYKQMELLKNDIQVQNEKAESLREELNEKTRKFEVLRGELEEKEGLLSKNLTEEVKIGLEAKIDDLEGKLKTAEDKIQAQLERMKKLTANLKKKTVICQELEARIVELEEKWTTEKDEKEAKNKQIQEVEILIREKDNRITDLEEKLTKSRNESIEVSKNLDRLSNDLTNSKEKMSLLTQQITDMEEEIVKLRANFESSTAALNSEKESKNNIISKFESYRQEVAEENLKRQGKLEEVTERARELNVRMQVMETEYLQQLTLINNLKAENGLLLSKQAQINEKLETVEKESEERRLLLEKSKAQGSEAEVKSHCEQCQTLVQALEAKLQEREAEIENLDNELANSIGNFVQMRESLRFNDMMGRNRSLEDNELLFQYNSLMASYEDVKSKLEEALKENKELIAKNEEMQFVNSTLVTEQASEENSENAQRLQGISDFSQEAVLNEIQNEQSNSLKFIDVEKLLEDKRGLEEEILSLRNSKLACERKIEDLSMELEVYKNQSSNPGTREDIQLSLAEEEKQLSSFKLMESQKDDTEKFLQEKRSLEDEISSLRNNNLAFERRIEDLSMELEIYKNLTSKSETGTQLDPIKFSESQEGETQKLLEDKRILEEQISSLKNNNLAFERRIEDLSTELEIYKNESAKQKMEAPQLFDASKLFGLPSSSDLLINNEVKQIQGLLDEKEAQCSNLTQEINHLQRLMIEERTQTSQNYSQCVEELEVSREQLKVAQANLEKLEQVVVERDSRIDWLNAELGNLSVQITEQSDTRKDNRVEELNVTLNSMRESLEKISFERDQQVAVVEACKMEIVRLEDELKNMTDAEATRELEKRVSALTKERDLLQLQVNDLSRSFEEHKDSTRTQIERITHERDVAREQVSNLTQILDQTSKESQRPTSKDVPSQETIKQQSMETTIVQDEMSGWDTGSTEKLNIDEDAWGWTSEDVLPASESQLALLSSTEIQLRATIDDLQDQIKDLEKDRERMIEESKSAQLRNAKMIKKLKEYKVQVENLQQQLKIQKSSDFYELDSAIEEELKSQISKLEKALAEAREEQRNMVSEKEALVKRLDVVVAANERYMEMKERQDMEMEVLRIRSKELSGKVEVLEKRLAERSIDVEGNRGNEDSSMPVAYQDVNTTVQTSGASNQDAGASVQRAKRSAEKEESYEDLCKKYKEKIDDLKDEMEALATENEQLQRFLEEQKMELSNLRQGEAVVEDKRVSELRGLLSKAKEEYDLLRKQYEQSLMDANDQVMIIRQNSDMLKEEAAEKTRKLEEEITELRRQLQVVKLNLVESQKNLEHLKEKEKLEGTSTSPYEENKLEAEIIELRQQLQATELNFLQSQKNLDDCLKEKESLEERLRTSITSYENQLSSLNASMAEITDLLNIRIQEAADLKQRQYAMTVNHEEAEMKWQQVIEELSRELNEKKQQIEALNEILSRKESVQSVQVVDQATQELIQKHTIEIEEKEEEIRDLREELSSLQAALNEINIKDKEPLQDQNEETVNILVNQATQELMQKHAIAMEEKEKEHREKLITFQSIEQENNLIQIELISTKEELNSREPELSRIKERLNSRELELSKIKEELNLKESELSRTKEEFNKLLQDNQKHLQSIDELEKRLVNTKSNLDSDQNLKEEIQGLRSALMEKESILQRISQESSQYKIIPNNNEKEIQRLETELIKKCEEINKLNFELEETRRILEETRRGLNEKQTELSEIGQPSSNIVDGLPLFRMTDDSQGLQQTIDTMQAELEKRQEEIEHLKYILNENTYPSMIQKMQERINCLYNEKSELEASLESANSRNEEKEELISNLRRQTQEVVSREKEGGMNPWKESGEDAVSRRSIQDQQIVRLQNDLYAREQEISELKYIISEKDSRLSLLSSMEPQSDDFELRETLQRLKVELCGREQEIQLLRANVSELEAEIVRLREIERLSADTRGALEKLNAEKEEERLQAEEFLQNKLKEKEMEIDEIKEKLAEENRGILDQLQFRDRDIENLKKQLEEFMMINQATKDELYQKSEDLKRVEWGLVEKERVLNEWSVSRDSEVRHLQRMIEEKEGERLRAVEVLQNKLKEKETEIDEIKKRHLQLRDRDIENLQKQLEEFMMINQATKNELYQKSEELNRVESSLVEKERILNEWTVARDSKVRNLQIMIEEKEARIEELLTLFNQEERRVTELRSILEARETEINSLKSLLEEKANEYRLIQNVLKKEAVDPSVNQGGEGSSDGKSQELDLALYMLHQRDVRCEELTHELMQLLEERDTLQLRLSNAIRVNEELRKGGLDSSRKEGSDGAEKVVVEEASPSRSEGPVEIAKEAIDDPIGEDKEGLALKLSQLHTVSHAKDVRLRDERELRHTQQMSLLAHKDVLSTLPPEAAARLVNANYTLSRDVQSQSSVLLNWLWGKSTPKVIHM